MSYSTALTRASALAAAAVIAAWVAPADAALITTGSAPVVAAFSQAVAGQPNLTANLTFSNFTVGGTTASMQVTIANTTGAAFTNARLTAFGFDTNPNPINAADTSSAYTATVNTTFPGFQTVDVCLYAGNNCAGGGNNGLQPGQSNGPFTLTLTFASALSQFYLGQDSPTGPEAFYVKFQTPGGSYEFASTPPAVPVPEPASLVLLGGGLLGLGMAARGRRREAGAAAR